jgi:hypothetical protein
MVVGVPLAAATVAMEALGKKTGAANPNEMAEIVAGTPVAAAAGWVVVTVGTGRAAVTVNLPDGAQKAQPVVV